MLEHPAVAEAGVIGKPDAIAFEVVKAFIALKPGHEPDDALRQDLLGFAAAWSSYQEGQGLPSRVVGSGARFGGNAATTC